jgi:hypothetical protein
MRTRIETVVRYYYRFFRGIPGDIVVYSKSNFINFIFMLVAILIKDKKVYFVDSLSNLNSLLVQNKNSIVVIDNKLEELNFMQYRLNVNIVLMVYERSLMQANVPLKNTYSVLVVMKNYSNFINGDYPYSSIKLTPRILAKYKDLVHDKKIIFYTKTKRLGLSNFNLANLYNSLWSEFKNTKDYYVDFSKASFRESFMYMLYFCLNEAFEKST